jgi:hypothetical protein
VLPQSVVPLYIYMGSGPVTRRITIDSHVISGISIHRIRTLTQINLSTDRPGYTRVPSGHAQVINTYSLLKKSIILED